MWIGKNRWIKKIKTAREAKNKGNRGLRVSWGEEAQSQLKRRKITVAGCVQPPCVWQSQQTSKGLLHCCWSLISGWSVVASTLLVVLGDSARQLLLCTKQLSRLRPSRVTHHSGLQQLPRHTGGGEQRLTEAKCVSDLSRCKLEVTTKHTCIASTHPHAFTPRENTPTKNTHTGGQPLISLQSKE